MGPEDEDAQDQPTRRSSQNRKATTRMQELEEQRREGIVAYAAEYVSAEALDPNLYAESSILDELDDPIAFAMKATTDPDTLYYSEAMKAPDAKNFQDSMVKEATTHAKRKHWVVIFKEDVPEGQIILPAVWAMRRKRRIATREVYKWKARLNIGGHKMVQGMHYDQTYAPVIDWPTI